MNAKQTNKLASYTATEAVLKATPEVANIPGFPGKLETLSARVGEINSLAIKQTQPVQLSTMERDLLFDVMTDQTLEIAGFVRTVAREQKLPLLAQAVQLGRGSFRRVRRSHRIWFAQRVLDAAQTVPAQLAAFGVTADALSNLSAAIEAAREATNRPREMVAAKKAATEQLVALFTEIDALLGDEIDPLVFPLRKTNAEFYATYQAARSIVHLPGNRTAGPGEVSPAKTNTAPSAPSPTTTSPTPAVTGPEQEMAA